MAQGVDFNNVTDYNLEGRGLDEIYKKGRPFHLVFRGSSDVAGNGNYLLMAVPQGVTVYIVQADAVSSAGTSTTIQLYDNLSAVDAKCKIILTAQNDYIRDGGVHFDIPVPFRTGVFMGAVTASKDYRIHIQGWVV